MQAFIYLIKFFLNISQKSLLTKYDMQYNMVFFIFIIYYFILHVVFD